MSIQEYISALQKRFPEMGKKVRYDKTEHGEEFCELVYPNPSDENFPLTFTVFEDGGRISFSDIEKVTGEGKLSPEQIICAAEDIISDSVMFVFCYENPDKKENHRLRDSYVFPLGEDSENYSKFIEKIKTPLMGFLRIFTPLKGVFVVRNFSGSENFEVTR